MSPSAIRTTLLCASLLASTAAIGKVEVEAVQHQTAGRILAVSVSEDIAPGDYETLFKGLTANPGKYAKKLALLDNIGGSVPEAIKMGRLLREAGFDTLVQNNAVCQGSCVYLLAAGRDKTVRGHVGIHRPYFANGDSALANQAGNASRYSPAAYFKEMNIPSSLADDMQSIAPSNLRVLTALELASYRLD
ncbi:MAG: hypothetical protein KAX95_01325 [Pseudomonas sp.]|nr:hypothetical protein [Pseudomonas sp.]